ncbi:MAG: hypothetical protein RMI91_13800 [Gemmatales bacterium]|nr:hypothetical protein [Gemmatales bacterium]MDW7995718.1 hypothetical protein [Gemmatales bacterium]
MAKQSSRSRGRRYEDVSRQRKGANLHATVRRSIGVRRKSKSGLEPSGENSAPAAAERRESASPSETSSATPLRLEWWEADRLPAHPLNWRRHPVRQKEAVARLLREVGWAGALLYNERTGRLLDGHLRKELCQGQRVPVLVGSWSEEQERRILAFLDPLASLAEPEVERWQELLRSLAHLDATLAQALDEIAQTLDVPLAAETLESADAGRAAAPLPESHFEVIVECPDEPSQRQLYERLTAEGYRCRVLSF